MPPLDVPDYIYEEVKNSPSQTISDTSGDGVALYRSQDGRTEVDVYSGLKLDGYTEYDPFGEDEKWQFAISPDCDINEEIEYDPASTKTLHIEVKLHCKSWGNVSC